MLAICGYYQKRLRELFGEIMRDAYSVEIQLPKGDPNGLRIFKLPGWTGTGVKFARTGFQEASDYLKGVSQAGVYVLVGSKADSELPVVYIGEGIPVKRLNEHNRDRDKDFWEWAAVFTSIDERWTKAHIQHLESRLYEIAEIADDQGLCHLVNRQKPQLLHPLAGSDLFYMKAFLNCMRDIISLMGLAIFEDAKSDAKALPENRFSLKGPKGMVANAEERANGFVVLENSTAVLGDQRTIPNKAKVLRADLIAKKIMEKSGEFYVFKKDYPFSTPSLAASVIRGSSVNGRIEWKNSEGKSLNDLANDQ